MQLLVSPFRLGAELSPAPLIAADVLARWHRWLGNELNVAFAINHGGLWALRRVEGEGNPQQRLTEQREELEAILTQSTERLNLLYRPTIAFSLGPSYQEAGIRAFLELFERGHLKRESVVVPWCSACLTILDPNRKRDDRTETVQAHEILVQLKGSEKRVPVLFTHPELLAATVGLAIHPEDKKYGSLLGRSARLPLYGREVKVVGTAHQTVEGQVRPLLPAYDQADLTVAQAKQLSVVDVLDREGTMNAGAGRYAGLTREAARERVLEDLEDAIGETAEVEVTTVQCEICRTDLTFRLADEWFVDLGALKDRLDESKVLDRLRPPSFRRCVEAEANREKWCINRTSDWGVGLPVWFCSSCDELLLVEAAPAQCTHCGSGAFTPSAEKLSAGFLASLWPLTAGGWVDEEPEGEAAAEIDTILFNPEESEIAYLTLCVSGEFELERIPRAVTCLQRVPTWPASDGTDVDVVRVSALAGSGAEEALEETHALLAGLKAYVREVAPLGAAPGLPDREPPLLERWITSSLRRGVQLLDHSLQDRRVSHMGALLVRTILQPLLEVYAPRAKGRPSDDVAAVTYELSMRALPYVALLAPGTAGEIWNVLFDRPLTIEAFPHMVPGDDEIDRPLLRRVRLLLRLAAAFAAESGAEERAVLRGPRTLAASIVQASKAFDLTGIATAFERSCSPDTVYRARKFGDVVLLLPVDGEDSGNLPDVVRRLRKRGEELKRRGGASRRLAAELAELIGDLKRLLGSGRPLSSSRES